MVPAPAPAGLSTIHCQPKAPKPLLGAQRNPFPPFLLSFLLLSSLFSSSSPIGARLGSSPSNPIPRDIFPSCKSCIFFPIPFLFIKLGKLGKRSCFIRHIVFPLRQFLLYFSSVHLPIPGCRISTRANAPCCPVLSTHGELAFCPNLRLALCCLTAPPSRPSPIPSFLSSGLELTFYLCFFSSAGRACCFVASPILSVA